MANPSKSKGDIHEREAVEYFKELCPDLLVWNAQRMLGAGRKEDIGDLLVFPDAAVQVKAFKAASLSAAIYQAAGGAKVQAERARHPYALGMVLVPRARKVGAVRWAACVHEWPIAVADPDIHSNALSAFEAVKTAGPEAHLVTRVQRKGVEPVYIGSVQSWVSDYRTATARPADEVAA